MNIPVGHRIVEKDILGEPRLLKTFEYEETLTDCNRCNNHHEKFKLGFGKDQFAMVTVCKECGKISMFKDFSTVVFNPQEIFNLLASMGVNITEWFNPLDFAYRMI